MATFKRRSLVEVIWEDACEKAGWSHASKYAIELPITTRSVGYRVRNDKIAVVLLQSHNSNDECNDAIVIPRAMIRHVTLLRK